MDTTMAIPRSIGAGVQAAASKSWYGLEDLAASEALLSSLPPVPSLPDLPSFLLDSGASTSSILSDLQPLHLPSSSSSSSSSSLTISPFASTLDYNAQPFSVASVINSTAFPLTTAVTPTLHIAPNDPLKINSAPSPSFVGNDTNALAKEVLDLAFGLKLKIMEQHNVLKQLQHNSTPTTEGRALPISLQSPSDLQQEVRKIEFRERLKQETIEREHRIEIERYASRLAQLEEHIIQLQQQQMHSQQQSTLPLTATITTMATTTDAANQRCLQLETENEDLKQKVEALELKARQDTRRIEELLELNAALKTSISEQILPVGSQSTTSSQQSSDGEDDYDDNMLPRD